MRRVFRTVVPLATAAVIAGFSSSAAVAQRHHAPPAAQHRAVQRGAVVFVGGYFYDPFFGPYPWWAQTAYPFPYLPVYDDRAIVRVIATPKDAAVYVDGFYAGTVHDFNDWFQGLPLPPGGHEIVLFLEGYGTIRDRVYLTPGSTFKLQRMLHRVEPGQTSEPPTLAPPVPPPPAGTYLPPRTDRPRPPTR